MRPYILISISKEKMDLERFDILHNSVHSKPIPDI